MGAQDDPEIVAIEQEVGTQFYTRLLGWVGATLATAGVTINFPNDFAAKLATITIGLLALALHELMTRFNQRETIKTAHAVGFSNGLARAKEIAASPTAAAAPNPVSPTPAPKPLTDKIDS